MKTRIVCPECGSTDLRVEATTVCTFRDPDDPSSGLDPCEEAEYAYHDGSFTLCASCEHEGAFATFAGPRPPGWIPATTRPPEHGKDVLVSNGRFVELGRYDPETGSWFWYQREFRDEPVTHWMPRPDPPETEDDR